MHRISTVDGLAPKTGDCKYRRAADVNRWPACLREDDLFGVLLSVWGMFMGGEVGVSTCLKVLN